MSRRNKVLVPKVKPRGALSFHIKLTLQPGRDDDLIRELEATPLGKVAGKVREMMRNGISTGRFLADDSGEQLDVDMGSVGLDL